MTRYTQLALMLCVAVAGTSADIVTRLNGEVNESLKSSELTAGMVRLGFEPVASTPEEFARGLASELATIKAVFADLGIEQQ